jgi:2-polyprenyl-6-methoxyphenol hydroxylase-like FAD-dependent oxidoreductase
VREVTPESLFNLSQPELEEFFQEEALKTGLVSIHCRWKWKDYEIDQNGDPISEVTNRDSGEILKVKARFVIGADGTDSAVRKKLANVKWEILPGHSADRVFFTSIHAKGDLRAKMTEMNRKGQLYFMLHPRVKGAIIIYDLSSSWVFAREIDPVEEPISTFTEEMCRQLIDPCVGPGIKNEIASVNSWFTDPRICSSYSTQLSECS